MKHTAQLPCRCDQHLVLAQGTSPIYNLLPDMLSSMSQDAGLSEESFQAIMMHLLTFIGKAKHVDSLVGQLCLRFSTTQVGCATLPLQSGGITLCVPTFLGKAKHVDPLAGTLYQCFFITPMGVRHPALGIQGDHVAPACLQWQGQTNRPR